MNTDNKKQFFLLAFSKKWLSQIPSRIQTYGSTSGVLGFDTARKSGSPPFGLSLATETVPECKTAKLLTSTSESVTWQAVASQWFLESALRHPCDGAFRLLTPDSS